jgi:hypothetical protein
MATSQEVEHYARGLIASKKIPEIIELSPFTEFNSRARIKEAGDDLDKRRELADSVLRWHDAYATAERRGESTVSQVDRLAPHLIQGAKKTWPEYQKMFADKDAYTRDKLAFDAAFADLKKPPVDLTEPLKAAGGVFNTVGAAVSDTARAASTVAGDTVKGLVRMMDELSAGPEELKRRARVRAEDEARRKAVESKK